MQRAELIKAGKDCIQMLDARIINQKVVCIRCLSFGSSFSYSLLNPNVKIHKSKKNQESYVECDDYIRRAIAFVLKHDVTPSEVKEIFEYIRLSAPNFEA